MMSSSNIMSTSKTYDISAHGVPQSSKQACQQVVFSNGHCWGMSQRSSQDKDGIGGTLAQCDLFCAGLNGRKPWETYGKMWENPLINGGLVRENHQTKCWVFQHAMFDSMICG